jgi:cyclophilin family peptidyl-prolyl cis-trans isomerase
MTTSFRACGVWASLALLAAGGRAAATEVAICTDLGKVTIELDAEHAPLHAANFLRYVRAGAYSGTVFHRVLPGLVVQGGGLDRGLQRRVTFEPVANESRNGLSNVRGTVAAARTSDPDSATAQFFINVADNTEFDAGREPGYTVFGRVTSGMDVVDAIAALPTASAGALPSDVPEPIVAMSSVAVIDRAALAELPAEPAALLHERIGNAAGNAEAVLEAVDQLRATCAALDPSTLFAEAGAAAAKQPLRARYALDDYFRLADSTDPEYAQAKALYARLAPHSHSGTEPLVAHCSVPNLPEIPAGRTADLDTMLAGQAAVRSFIEDSEMYLDCLAEAIDRESLSDAEHSSAVRQHNQMVQLMEDVAEDFNREVRAFKAGND